MNLFPILVLSLFGCTVVNSVVVRKKVERKESSSSSSSEDRPPRRRQKPRYYSEEKPRSRPRPQNDERGCPEEWMTFNRPQGTWCVKVFYGINVWSAAQAACGTHGAKLTGFQNANERMQVANAGRALSNLYYGGLQDIWVDGVRRPECPGKTSCAPLNAFQWTDGHTTGTDGFFLPGPEPNAFGDCKQGVQSVTVIHISPADGVAASYGYPHGAMNDNCYELPAKLYACGKLPA